MHTRFLGVRNLVRQLETRCASEWGEMLQHMLHIVNEYHYMMRRLDSLEMRNVADRRDLSRRRTQQLLSRNAGKDSIPPNTCFKRARRQLERSRISNKDIGGSVGHLPPLTVGPPGCE